jgi:hypothetical protein
MKDFPEMIDMSTDMNEPNSSIKIFSGDFVLKHNETIIPITGHIEYKWFPNSSAHFCGEPKCVSKDLIEISTDSVLIFVDGLEFGKGYINQSNFGSDGCFISGIISSQAILWDNSISVNKVLFSVPNLRDFHGLPVQKGTDKTMSRLSFKDEKYTINIDKCRDYSERLDKLENNGGYHLLYSGEISSNKGSISFEQTKDILGALNVFLTFLNGRKTSAIFIKGVFEDTVVWNDFSSYYVDDFKNVQTWPQRHSIEGLNDLWKKFCDIWKDTDDRNFLNSVIHWYIESNVNSGLIEGSIIMAQTALELIYNWWIIEKKRIIIGKDSENINASNKIRLLLSQLNINSNVPTGLSNLNKFVQTTDFVTDAPDGIVFIRNAIVHSQEEKRKKLSAIDGIIKYEALQLYIWYIEMSLLCILDYRHSYFNRCSDAKYVSKAEEKVPWTS